MDRWFRDLIPSSQTTRQLRDLTLNTILKSSQILHSGTQALNQLRELTLLTQIPVQRCHVLDTDFLKVTQSLHILRDPQTVQSPYSVHGGAQRPENLDTNPLHSLETSHPEIHTPDISEVTQLDTDPKQLINLTSWPQVPKQLRIFIL